MKLYKYGISSALLTTCMAFCLCMPPHSSRAGESDQGYAAIEQLGQDLEDARINESKLEQSYNQLAQTLAAIQNISGKNPGPTDSEKMRRLRAAMKRVNSELDVLRQKIKETESKLKQAKLDYSQRPIEDTAPGTLDRTVRSGFDFDGTGSPQTDAKPAPVKPPPAKPTKVRKWYIQSCKSLMSFQSELAKINKVADAMKNPDGSTAQQFNKGEQAALERVRNNPEDWADLRNRTKQMKSEAEQIRQVARQARGNLTEEDSNLDIDGLIAASNEIIKNANTTIAEIQSIINNL